MTESLLLASGVFWMMTYVLIIRRAHADQAYGMPIVAWAANVSWELLFSFVWPMGPPQLYVNVLWFLLDLPIAYQCFRYGRRDWADRLSSAAFGGGFALVLALAFALVALVSAQFEMGHRYAAFGQNLMMSALFIALRLRRGDNRGQSAAIAACKLLGTGLASVYCVITGPRTPLFLGLFVSILVLDGIYLAMLQSPARNRTDQWRAGSLPSAPRASRTAAAT
jgi:hypothetical protein